MKSHVMQRKMASMKVCFAVGLFMIAWFRTGFSEDIPDDVVYTEIKKTLVNGTKGILTCQFKGTPNAVYWIKGSDSNVALSFLTWAFGSKSGPRYEDGSCDMDENYSLIINNVRHEDAGRYICEISNYDGFLIYNFTDVTITNVPVKTEKNVLVQKGEVGVIPCQVNIRSKRVSWVRSPNSTIVTMDLFRESTRISGPAYEQGLFNITKEYSLVINDVTIQHEDRFFCEVTDFDTDEMYRDDTSLTVFARPTTPFPTIEGCPMEDHTNCVIITDSSTTLTCYANDYYPDINLLFIHGSRKVEYLATQTWNNTDGTKNKSITISTDKSKDTYKCIASEIPGLEPNDEVSASVRLIEKQRSSLIFIVILVPIMIFLAVILLTWMRIRKIGRRLSVPMEMARFIEGHISYVELWKLVENAFGNHEQKLNDVITLLNEKSQTNESQTNMDQDRPDQNYYYKKLCEWKETCDQTINQRNVLSDACFHQDLLKESFSKVEDFRKPTSTEVPSCDLDYILWQINDPQKILVFLRTLGVHIPKEMLSLRKKAFMQEAMNQLVSWTKGSLPFNAVVIISCALEKLELCRAENNFFQIPARMKHNIDNQELKSFVKKTWSTELLHIFFEFTEPDSEIMLSNALEDNGEVLFNTEKMLLDWWEYAECSNYEKRLILNQVFDRRLNNIKQPVVKGMDHHLSDEELKLISRYLNSKSMASVCDKLHTTSLPEDADEKRRFDVLWQWRTAMNKKEWTSLYGQLRSALEEIGASGILSPLRSDPVLRAEYVDIAFDLLMTDVLPIAQALGKNVNKFPAYTPAFEHSHLAQGTIGLVARLVESLNKDDSRRIMCSRLREAGFSSTAHKMEVYPVGYGELYAISDAMTEADCKQGAKGTSDNEEKPPGERDAFLFDKASAPKDIETPAEKRPREERQSERHLRDIKNMFKLTGDEVAAHPMQTERLDEFTLFKVWKERQHPPVLNERAAIIQGLIDIDRPEIARSVVEGKYHTKELSLRFINHLVARMDEKELQKFVDTFDLRKEVERADWLDSDVSQMIHDFLKNAKDKSGFLSWNKSKSFRNLCNKLVDNDFLDIARELIIIHK